MTKLSTPVATLGVLIFGTSASLLAKLIYSVQAVNSHGDSVPFTKPWFQVLGMFLGMSVCILLDLPSPAKRAAASAKAAALGSPDEASALLDAAAAADADADAGTDDSDDAPPATPVWIINFPTLFDLFATACGTTGLLYTTVSVYQMLRGAQLVFTALLSIAFLGRRLSALNYAGISLCMVGIVLVGLANVWGEGTPASKSDTIFGIAVILAGQVLQAAQVVLEEHLLQNLNMSSVRIVAYEGMFGVLHCLAWVFPIVFFLPGSDFGHLEDPFDAFYMVFHNWQVAAVIVLDMALMLAYNVCGMEVTNNLSAVSRVIIETLRTLFVWICDFILFYVVSGGRLGEAWTRYSYLQALGFLLTVIGTVCYNYEQLASDYRRRTRQSRSESKMSASARTSPRKSYGTKAGISDDLEAGSLDTAQVPSSVVADTSEGSPVSRQRFAEEIQRDTGIRPSTSHPLRIGSDDEDEDLSDEDHDGSDTGGHVGSFVGSASHGSFLAASSLSSSLRKRSVS